MTYTVVFIAVAVCSFVLQTVLSLKAKNPVIKSIPTGLLIVGLLFCLITYIGVGELQSASVIAENQAFAKFLAVHMAVSLIGCVTGAVLSKKRQAE